MLLGVDIGNSHTVVGVFEGDLLRQHFRISTDRNRTADEYGALLTQLLLEAGVEWKVVHDSVVSSVVPPLTEGWERLITRRLGKPPLVIGPGVKTGIAIRSDNPREVGADRIVNGVAGFELYRESGGVVVVDFGTATTFDVVSERCEYLGGAIAPGVMISAEALFQRASKLPRVDLAMPESPIGKTTVGSMQAGILFGYVGLVEGMIERIRAEVSFPVRVVATGGVATLIADHTRAIDVVDEDLTLRGLQLIYERNER